jgi:phosphate starvation-inducible PhoH-like protein
MSNKNGTLFRTGNGIDVIPERFFDEEDIKQGRRKLRGKTPGQEDYIDCINQSIITLCAGVAGTGKTYVATAKAIEMLQSGAVSRIILTRPVVECGRGLGFVPGELDEKFSLYTGPFQDALHDFLHEKELKSYITNEIIKFAPLDYMRGMTFKKSAMILDEAQNATIEQIRMFMTRIGSDSRMIITGDTSQCDLDPRRGEAFREILETFARPPYVDGLNITRLGKQDIVRHSIIQKIIEKIGE